ncbi:Phenylacetate-coenzyme A ligase [Phycisphaerae bacterium RAS1]|nr:Phenylacetate-coenzyme A ligase [Phycisphaerae bacterium RAS1]
MANSESPHPAPQNSRDRANRQLIAYMSKTSTGCNSESPDGPRLARAAAELRGVQSQRLRELLPHIAATSRFYARKWAECLDAARAGRLEDLPLTTRGELQQDQADHPPFGSNLTRPVAEYTRFHQTSGSNGVPLRWLDTPESWEWWKRCWAAVYEAAGVTGADRVVFAFSFGPFIGFWSAFESAAALGCLCLPAGGMSTPGRLRYILDNRATVICCTPTYALHLVEAAAAEGIELGAGAVGKIIVAGEPGGSLPAVRQRIERGWNARVYDHAGLTEVGAWGFECSPAPGGMHINEAEFVAEVINPTTGAAAADGDGELVLTNLGRAGSPVVRYRTGDHVRLRSGQCACGRAFVRVEGGVMGRVDDMLIIRGNNVFPSAIESILRSVAGVAEFRIVVTSRGALSELTLEVEPAADADAAAVAHAASATIRNRLHFGAAVRIVAPGSLPRFEMKSRRVVRSTDAEA